MFFYSDELIPLFEFDYIFQIDTSAVMIWKYFWQTSTTYISQWLIVNKLDPSVHQNIYPWVQSRH